MRMMPSERSVTRDLMATDRTEILLFSLQVYRISDSTQRRATDGASSAHHLVNVFS